MEDTFRKFVDTYLKIWRSSSISELKNIISKDYKGREIANGVIVDFGYEESILGWEQGFQFVKENDAKWELKEIAILPLRVDETLAIISASMTINGKSLDTANVFFQTFKKDSSGDWKLIRSYIEAGITKENLSEMQFN